MNDYLVRWSNPGETIDSRGFSFSFYTFVLRSTRSFEFLFGYKVVKVEEEGYRRVGGRRTTRLLPKIAD